MKEITLIEVLKLSIELENTKQEAQDEKVEELETLENKFVNASIKQYQVYE